MHGQASNCTTRLTTRCVGWLKPILEIGAPDWRDGQLVIELLYGQARAIEPLLRCCSSAV